MGIFCSCCKDPTPGALQADPRAALRAGGRIRVEKNVTEDPRAPLLTKTMNSINEKEAALLDKDLEALANELSSGSGNNMDDDEFENLIDAINEEEDQNNAKND